MGTYAILKALWSYWSNAAYPMHRIETYPLPFPPISRLRLFFRQTRWKTLLILGAAVLAVITAAVLCTETHTNPLWSLVLRVWSLGGLFGFALVAIALLLLSYLWPLVVAVRASRAIATEREYRTWDVLLTLPYDRTELLLGKLSSALRSLNVYGGTVLWTQSFLMLITFVLVNGYLLLHTDLASADKLLALVLLVVVMVEFAVVRVQDYVLASLIGAFAALAVPTRQAASTIALVAAIGMILIRALCTALPLLGASVLSGNALLVMATGPSSLIAMALPIPLALMALLVIPFVRELIIRWAFGWLVRHLSETPTTA